MSKHDICNITDNDNVYYEKYSGLVSLWTAVGTLSTVHIENIENVIYAIKIFLALCKLDMPILRERRQLV